MSSAGLHRASGSEATLNFQVSISGLLNEKMSSSFQAGFTQAAMGQHRLQ